MIIIEGMDNTGKTSLLNKLADVFKVTKVRLENAPTATESEFRNYLWFNLTRTDHNQCIYDRFLLSELVYGPILRNNVRLDGWENEGALELLAYKRPLIIYCKRTREQILETFGEREQLNGVEENIDGILSNYEYFLGKLKEKGALIYEYDYGRPMDFLHVILWIDRNRNPRDLQIHEDKRGLFRNER